MRNLLNPTYRKRRLRIVTIQAKKLTVRYLKRAARLPLVVRLLLGLLLCVGGVFGILPILGFWMLPLGVLVFGLCIPFTDRLISNWVGRLEAEISVDQRVRSSL